MAMTDEQFEELVAKLETESKVHTGRYKQKVFGFALLGYGYIALVFIGVLGAIAIVIAGAVALRTAGIVFKLILPLVVLLGFMARALWVRFPKPEGKSLGRNEARALFELTKEFRRTLKSPRMHKIMLTDYLQSVFWPDLFKRANDDPEPPTSPFLEMANAFRSGFTVDQAGQWLAESLQRKTGCADTHPCLADRLAALGITAEPPSSNENTAAQALLGINEAPLCDRLGEEWHQSITARWKERHQYAREAQSRLAELDSKDSSLTVDEEWERARYTEEFRDSESALPFYEKVLALDPKHAGASFAVGRLSIQEDYPRATTLIEHAMKLDDDYVIPGCQLLYSHLISSGREREAEQYKNRLINQSASYEAARAERSIIRSTDVHISHNLNWDQLQKLAEQFEKYPDIKRAYVACKRVKYFPRLRFM